MLTGDEYAAEVQRAVREDREPDFTQPSPTPGNIVIVPVEPEEAATTEAEAPVEESVVESALKTSTPVAKKK